MSTDNDLIRRYLNSGKSNLTEEDVFGNLGVEAAPQLEEAAPPAPIPMDEPLTPEDVASFGPAEAPVPDPVPAPLPEDETAPVLPVTQDVVTGQTQTEVTKESKPSEGAIAAQTALEKSIDDQDKAAEALMKATKAKEAEQFNLTQAQNEIIQNAAKREQEIRQAGDELMKAELAAIDAQVKELESQKYEGYWSNKSVGSKILGALAIGLGAYGSALTGGPNNAFKIIEKAMDEDFNSFKENTATKIKAIQQSRLSADRKNALVKEQLLGLQAKREADLSVVENKINALSLKHPAHAEKLAKLQAELAQKKAESRLAFEKGRGKEIQTQVQKKIETIRIDPKTGQPIPEVDPELQVPGLGQARSKKEAQDLRAKTAETVGNVQTIDRILELQKKASRLNPDVAESYKARQQIQNEIASLVGSMRVVLTGPGAMSDSEREFIQGIIGDPTSIFSFSSVELAKLQDIRNKAVRNLDNIAKQVIVNYQGYQGTDSSLKKQPTEAPHGKRVKQNGKTYVWDGQKYVEE